MARYPTPAFAELIDRLNKLPGIGRVSAERLAYHIMYIPEKESTDLAKAIVFAKRRIHLCPKCCNYTESELCNVCANPKRDHTTICVVEEPKDVLALEKTNGYSGEYHVLHGAISPINGIGPENLKIKELLDHVKSSPIKEVILATNTTIEGETTSVYISKLLKPLNVKVTRIAYGLPAGGNLEYADEVTISRALNGRSIM